MPRCLDQRRLLPRGCLLHKAPSPGPGTSFPFCLRLLSRARPVNEFLLPLLGFPCHPATPLLVVPASDPRKLSHSKPGIRECVMGRSQKDFGSTESTSRGKFWVFERRHFRHRGPEPREGGGRGSERKRKGRERGGFGARRRGYHWPGVRGGGGKAEEGERGEGGRPGPAGGARPRPASVSAPEPRLSFLTCVAPGALARCCSNFLQASESAAARYGGRPRGARTAGRTHLYITAVRASSVLSRGRN